MPFHWLIYWPCVITAVAVVLSLRVRIERLADEKSRKYWLGAMAFVVAWVILWSAFGTVSSLRTLLFTAGPVLLALLFCTPHAYVSYLLASRKNRWTNEQVMTIIRFYGNRRWGVTLESPVYDPGQTDNGTHPTIRLRFVAATDTGVDTDRQFTLTLSMASMTQWYFLMLDYDLDTVDQETVELCIEHDCLLVAYLGYDGHQQKMRKSVETEHNH